MTRKHKECYGTMFPGEQARGGGPMAEGKVFAVETSRRGGLWPSLESIHHDIGEWDDCLNCPEFEHCYKLCMAKLALKATHIPN